MISIEVNTKIVLEVWFVSFFPAIPDVQKNMTKSAKNYDLLVFFRFRSSL